MRALALVLLLAGCGGPSLSKNQRSEVSNIAEDFADAAASNAIDGAPQADTSKIESRLDDLESGERRAISADKVELDSLQNHGTRIDATESKLDRLIDHYNDHINKYHGGG